MVSNTPMHRTALLLLIVSVQSGELRLGQWALPTTAHIRTMIGSNSEARGVIREALELFFIIPKTPTDTPRSVNVLAEQLPTDWLPQVHGVTFLRLDLKDAQRKWQEGCLRLLWITVESRGTTIKLTVSDGNRCENTTLVFEFSRTYRGGREVRASRLLVASHIAVVSRSSALPPDPDTPASARPPTASRQASGPPTRVDG
jgi:hypothetical protein